MPDEIIPPGMGRCEITNKIVPEDELVTFSGKRVCAEGKAIFLDELRAGKVTFDELEKPFLIQRCVCFLIDRIIIAVPYYFVFIFILGYRYSRTGHFTYALTKKAGLSSVTLGIISLAFAVAEVSYIAFMHGKFGQTIGKMIGKIKVVRFDGSTMDYKTVLIRTLMSHGIALATAFPIMSGNFKLMDGMKVILGWYALLNFGIAFFDRYQQRALHDHIAKTRVVKIIR